MDACGTVSSGKFNRQDPNCHKGDVFGEFRHCRINDQPREGEYDAAVADVVGSYNPRTGA